MHRSGLLVRFSGDREVSGFVQDGFFYLQKPIGVHKFNSQQLPGRF